MADRTPIFEMHILPMFRLLDRLHMKRVNQNLDLWDYDSVKANASQIVTRALGDQPSMPTASTGGAWPSEWRNIFQRWIDGGFRRLSLGTGQNYKLAKSGNDFVLSCSVAIPASPDRDAAAWFDIVNPGPTAATYRLYLFPGDAVPPATNTFNVTAQERVDAAAAANGVTVIDAAGSRSVTVTTT